MSLSKGFNNLFKPTIINFILAGCIIIILVLIFIRYGKIDLFTDNTIPLTTNTIPTSQLTLISGNDYLTTFINKYINNIQQQNTYIQQLAKQQQTINNLTQQVEKLVNTS